MNLKGEVVGSGKERKWGRDERGNKKEVGSGWRVGGQEKQEGECASGWMG